MYFVEQKSGQLATAAAQLTQAVAAHDWVAVAATWQAAMGTPPPVPLGEEYTWWRFNAPDRIRRNHGITVAQVRAAGGDVRADKRYARICCRLAQRKHGGTWEYHYEY